MLNKKMCVLIADDEARILKAMKDFFAANGYHVLLAGDGGKALEAYYGNSTRIDIILLDVMMPVTDGFAVLREIRETSLIPVIMLTARGEEYDQIKGFRAGADDYVTKPFSPSLLLARVEAVLKRVGKGASGEIAVGDLRVNTLTRSALLGDRQLELTPREFDLLYYFMLNRGAALTREQMLDAVWGYGFEGDLRTVDTHVKQLRGKLGGSQSVRIGTVHRVGYRFEAE
ncbi:MAG: response regulator transcription factor [Clostridiales Family XIII bacterium]|jgi:DNA-binding response OmpR family regulator|nr:response regulator transcription factor [Clostridiales Family XIII bacterium]